MTSSTPHDAANVGHANTRSVWRLGWRVSQNAPKPFWIGSALFILFFMLPALSGWLIGLAFDGLANADTRSLYWIAGGLALAELCRLVAIYYGAIQFTISWTLMQSLLQSNMLAAQVASGGPLAGRPTGSAGQAISYFRDDPKDVADFVDSWLDVSGGVAYAVVALMLLGATDWRATLVVMVPMVVVAIVTKSLDDRVKTVRRADRDATAAMTATLGDVLAAATSVGVNDAAPTVVDEIGRLADRRGQTAVKDRVLEDGLLSFATGSSDVAFGLMLVVSAGAIAAGDLAAGEIALFSAILAYMSFLPRMIGRMLARRKQSQVSFENMASLVGGQDPTNTATRRSLPVRFVDAAAPEQPQRSRVPLQRLEVENLQVRFGETPALDPVSFVIEPGSFTVVTGPIGTGKSSLLRALLGLVWQGEVSGSVRWNGAEVEDRAGFFSPPHASFLPQVPQLISDSLADNILLGSLSGPPGALALERALGLAAVDLDVAEMADGVDTLVGPRGLRLSGGQRQRVATARALARSSELIVLDDLSSALDVETELELWRNLRADGLTVLAVSHRAVAMDLADQVIELPSRQP